MNVTSQPWFGWAFVIVIGLPVLVLVLAEVHLRLQRKDNALAGPVNRLRIWLLPLTALLILLTKAAHISSGNAGVRIVATVVGVMAVAVVLGGLNAVLFGNATEGTWRERLPSIFVDLARLILVAAGAAAVASYVWGLDVGGLWATLGVGSIVIGLALQNAVGSVISGLLLLFEQPFRLGDTIEVGGVQGRVAEMNWRATHLDTGASVQVIPNAAIAGASFSNLSRPTPAHDQVVPCHFAASDTPHEVTLTLTRVAQGLPMLRPGAEPTVRNLGAGDYSVTLPLVGAKDAGRVQSIFSTRLWYAARRHELSLDGEAFVQHPVEEVVAALQSVRSTLDVTDEEIAALAPKCEIETYGEGETMVTSGRVPTRFAFVLSGRVRLLADTLDGAQLPITELEAGDVVSGVAMLRAPAIFSCLAVTNVDIVQIPLDEMDELLSHKPGVARTLNALVRSRDEMHRQKFEEVNSSDQITAPVLAAAVDLSHH